LSMRVIPRCSCLKTEASCWLRSGGLDMGATPTHKALAVAVPHWFRHPPGAREAPTDTVAEPTDPDHQHLFAAAGGRSAARWPPPAEAPGRPFVMVLERWIYRGTSSVIRGLQAIQSSARPPAQSAAGSSAGDATRLSSSGGVIGGLRPGLPPGATPTELLLVMRCLASAAAAVAGAEVWRAPDRSTAVGNKYLPEHVVRIRVTQT